MKIIFITAKNSMRDNAKFIGCGIFNNDHRKPYSSWSKVEVIMVLLPQLNTKQYL